MEGRHGIMVGRNSDLRAILPSIARHPTGKGQYKGNDQCQSRARWNGWNKQPVTSKSPATLTYPHTHSGPRTSLLATLDPAPALNAQSLGLAGLPAICCTIATPRITAHVTWTF